MKPLNVSKPRSTCCKLCAAAAILLLSVFLLLIVLGLTVFRPRSTITVVNSVRLTGVRAGFIAPALGLDLNATLLLDISVTNPNRAGFSYPDGGAAELYYRGSTLVGEVAIPPGEIGAGETVEMNVTLTVMAARLVANSNVYADVLAGSLPLTTSTRIAGRVTVLGSFKHHVVAYTTCDVVVNIATQTVTNSGLARRGRRAWSLCQRKNRPPRTSCRRSEHQTRVEDCSCAGQEGAAMEDQHVHSSAEDPWKTGVVPARSGEVQIRALRSAEDRSRPPCGRLPACTHHKGAARAGEAQGALRSKNKEEELRSLTDLKLGQGGAYRSEPRSGAQIRLGKGRAAGSVWKTCMGKAGSPGKPKAGSPAQIAWSC